MLDNINMAKRATHSIPISKFDSYTENFTKWVKRFESAVVLATNVTDEAQKLNLYKKWLTLKLDERGRNLLKICTKDDWKELKVEFGKLLIDPQERYNWQVRRSTITWDGKESFHALANRIRTAVDNFDANANNQVEYFFRFREALPRNYRQAIDLGCDEKKRTIDEAKKLALRSQMADVDS